MSVVMNGRTYSLALLTGSDGYAYADNGASGEPLWPDQIFSDMLVELASAATVYGVAPGAAGAVLYSNGSAWVRSAAPLLTSLGRSVDNSLLSITGGTDGTSGTAAISLYGRLHASLAGQAVYYGSPHSWNDATSPYTQRMLLTPSLFTVNVAASFAGNVTAPGWTSDSGGIYSVTEASDYCGFAGNRWLGVNAVNGDFSGSLTVGSTITTRAGSAGSPSLKNSGQIAVADTGTNSISGMNYGLFLITDTGTGYTALFALSAAGGSSIVWQDSGNVYSASPGAGSKISVYPSGGSMVIQNQLGSLRAFYVIAVATL